MPLTKNNLNKLLNSTGSGNRKTQWKRLALKMHPNKGGNSNTFKNLSAAYNMYYKGKVNISTMPMNAAFTKAMNNFLKPTRKPTPPSENEKRVWNILRKTGLANKSWKGSDPIKNKLARSPIIRFKNQENINFFRKHTLHPYSHMKGPGNGRNLKPNRNYYFISTNAVPNKNRAKIFVLNKGGYSHTRVGLANKNELLKYFGLNSS
jgi:hypothetical protein